MRERRFARRVSFSSHAFAFPLLASALALSGCGAYDADGDQIARDEALLQGDSLTNPLVTIPMGTQTNGNPPDTNGDIGRDHYVQLVQPDHYRVWNKQGQALTGIRYMTDLWPAGDPCSAQGTDPIVLYDHLADRWLLSHLEAHYMCIAISKTPDPTAGASGWYAYTRDTAASPKDTSIPDFPKLAVWPDAYYMSSAGVDAAGTDSQVVYAFERAKMLAGDPSARLVRTTTPNDALSTRPYPADLDGPAPAAGTPGFFVRTVDDPAGDHIQVFAASPNFNAGTLAFNVVATLPVSNFDPLQGNRNGGGGGACAPQPHTTDALDCIARDQPILRYRNFGTYGAIVMLNVVDTRDQVVTFTPEKEVIGMRWYELRNQSGVWSLRQQGTFSPQPATTDESKLVHRWMASANIDREGNLALGYSATNASNDPGTELYPSIWYTGRNADDPLGTLSAAEHVAVAGVASQRGENEVKNDQGEVIARWARWGDYSSMSVDPVDGCTFWYTNHVADQPNSSFGKPTPITAFAFSRCAPAARQACVFGSQRVDLRDRVSVNATVGAVGSLELGSLTTVTGEVAVSGNVFMRDRSRIGGNLTYSGTLTRQNGTSVSGTITRAAVTLTPPPAKTVAAGSGDQSVTGQATLSPGTFGNVTFRSKSRVTLQTGNYAFASLNIEPDVVVDATGPVVVDVQGQFQLGDRSRVYAPSEVGFNVHSNATSVRIGTDAIFDGNISAPNASVSVYSRSTVNGCLAGKTVLVDTDTHVTEP